MTARAIRNKTFPAEEKEVPFGSGLSCMAIFPRYVEFPLSATVQVL